MKVEGLVAIITGGCSGLGLSACLLLLSKGCKVVMADIHPQGPSLALQHSCTFIHCDVSNESQVSSMVQQVLSLHSSIHILINSAGIIVTAPILSSKGPPSSDLLLKALKVNVVGTFNVTKYVVQAMAKQNTLPNENPKIKEKGVVINVASVAGIEGQRGQTLYSATKGAIIGMTLPLARDLGRLHIRVVTLAPGIFDTPMGATIKQEVMDVMNKMTPQGRPGQSQEFAQMCLSVAENSYLNGNVIRLDGAIRLAHL